MQESHAANLLARLEAIGRSLSKREDALALIGLGSAGSDIQRLDEYSDLDFFVIVAEGAKQAYLQDLSWLGNIGNIAYCFSNTADGYKLLFADGIFCEFAVFEQAELHNIPFAVGRVVWKREDIPATIAVSQTIQLSKEKPSVEWLLGEILTNLYVGLCRDARGEILSGARFIQGYAVDRLLELAEISANTRPVFTADLISIPTDEFARERRLEQRFPRMAALMPDFMQGYTRNRQSAQAILDFVKDYFKINQAMRQAILDLCQ